MHGEHHSFCDAPEHKLVTILLLGYGMNNKDEDNHNNVDIMKELEATKQLIS